MVAVDEGKPVRAAKLKVDSADEAGEPRGWRKGHNLVEDRAELLNALIVINVLIKSCPKTIDATDRFKENARAWKTCCYGYLIPVREGFCE